MDRDPKAIKKEEADSGEPDRLPKPADGAVKPMKKNGGSLTIGGIGITSPRKVIFEDPDITKEEVVRYYEAVSGRMLPYMERRLLSVVRCPKGVGAACFYKKHPGPSAGGIVTIPVTGGDGKTEEYFYIGDAAGLIAEAQMGTLEFHVWGSRAESLEAPDMMVFDLDPDEGMDLEAVRRGARDLKDILGQLSLISYLKTSGGKGYHIVVPFRPAASWDALHDFARRIAGGHGAAVARPLHGQRPEEQADRQDLH